MAPQYNTALTSAERRNAPILDRYMCRVCEVWKPHGHYSKKELNSYTNSHARGNRVTGVTAKLRCRGCAGSGITELNCKGPCKERKSLDQFSKNSRSAGGNKWCKTCTLWKESQEDGLISTAPPQAALAPDEDGGFFPSERMSSFYDPEAGDGEGSDDDYDYTATSSAWGAPDSVPKAPHSTVSGSAILHGNLDADFSNLSVSCGGRLPNASSSSSTSDWIAPHLRGSQASSSVQPRSENLSEASSSSSSLTNPYAAANSGKALVGAEWNAVDARRRPHGPAVPTGNPITYNAWDNVGRQHLQQRYPSSSEQSVSDSSSVVSSGSVASAASADTIRGQPNATPVRLVNGTAAVNVQQSSSNSNWAKPIGNRTQGPQYQPSRPSTAPKPAIDSDDDYM